MVARLVNDAPESVLERGDKQICIAILDGRVDLGHPCFVGADLTQLQTIVPQGIVEGKATAHGTHIASVIFGQPQSSIKGVAPYCRGLIIPIFTNVVEDDELSCSQIDLAGAIELAMMNGAHIINVSGGQLASTGDPEPSLARAIVKCAEHNVLIVASAGNNGCECLHVPAATSSVLAVGAMDEQGIPLASSNWGNVYRTQGVLAPGAAILGATPGGTTSRKNGTSFAAPFVSGVAGLLASFQIQMGIAPNLRAIREIILKSAFPCLPEARIDCRAFLAGRLNFFGAIELVAKAAIHYRCRMSKYFSPSENAGIPQDTRLSSPSVELATQAENRTIPNSWDSKPETRSAPLAAEALSGQRDSLVTPSDCGCGGGKNCTCGASTLQKPRLVYALGKLGYDFGSEARRDSIVQTSPGINPFLSEQILRFLTASPHEASSLIWTLNLDATPVYAIQPMGPFAATCFERLRSFLDHQITEGVEIVSVPGVIAGSSRLLSGQIVPVIVPVLRGMFSWVIQPVIEAALGPRPADPAELIVYDRQMVGLTDLFNRVYYDLRNLGVSAEDRALNYSVTNAFQVNEVVKSATLQELDLESIAVKRSPICRPDSDCYDVELAFFNPSNINIANRIYRFTVDVSDVVPVTIGVVRSWTRR